MKRARDDDLWQAQRVYLPQRLVAHLLPAWASPGDREPSLCGLLPHLAGWYGTGTWAERDTAKALPTCLNCERARRRTK